MFHLVALFNIFHFSFNPVQFALYKLKNILVHVLKINISCSAFPNLLILIIVCTRRQLPVLCRTFPICSLVIILEYDQNDDQILLQFKFRSLSI